MYLSEHRDEFERFIANEYNNFIKFIYIQTMSKDGQWADISVIAANADALNVEIYIIFSVQEATTITIRQITDNPSETISLGHIAHLHYASTRSLMEMQDAQKTELGFLRPNIIDSILI